MGQTPSVDALIKAIEQSHKSPPAERRTLSFTVHFPTRTLTEQWQGPVSKSGCDMGNVTRFFEGLNNTEIFEYCLGFDKPGAPALAERVVLIVLKCGTASQEPFLMDMGLHFIHREDMRDRLSCPGPHSANILNNVRYHHLRMQHNAHFANCLPNPNALENNHFGATRFVDEEEANAFLEASFAKRIKTEPVPLFYDPIRDEYVRSKYEEGEFRPIVTLNFDES
jgi:hypothetical protein